VSLLSVSEALETLLSAVQPLPVSEASLTEAAGRTLAESVAADRDAPPTDRSAMDGYAVRAADCGTAGSVLADAGEVRAGQDPAGTAVRPGTAVRIFTGAVVPEGADAVVMIERCAVLDDGAAVRIETAVETGQNIRRRGEERKAGETVLSAGAVLRAAEVAALAASGRTHVRVVRAPRVGVLSTGDEVVPVGKQPAPHQVRNSNAAMLAAQVAAMGFAVDDLGIARDDRGALDALLADGLTRDVLLVSGGVSVGAYDLVGYALSRAGCTTLFHTIAMRPGKPLLAATREGCLVLGLPGNPVSAFTSFQVFVAPAIRKLAGDPQPIVPWVRATLTSALSLKPGRTTYHLARLAWVDGRPQVTPTPGASSGDVYALSRADCFIVTPAETTHVAAGAEVDVQAWV
jgi:molybdopterin molybdotransferase